MSPRWAAPGWRSVPPRGGPSTAFLHTEARPIARRCRAGTRAKRRLPRPLPKLLSTRGHAEVAFEHVLAAAAPLPPDVTGTAEDPAEHQTWDHAVAGSAWGPSRPTPPPSSNRSC